MKKFSNLIKPDDPASSIGLNPTAAKDHRIAREAEALVKNLWPLMTSMYGHKFSSQFGEHPEETWESCLKGITGRQMADGLNNCLDAYPEWPPGAAQFRAMCLGKFIDKDGNDSSWQHRSAAYIDYRDAAHPSNDPNSREYVKKAPKGIEHQGYVSRRKKAGKRALDGMMDLFDK